MPPASCKPEESPVAYALPGSPEIAEITAAPTPLIAPDAVVVLPVMPFARPWPTSVPMP